MEWLHHLLLHLLWPPHHQPRHRWVDRHQAEVHRRQEVSLLPRQPPSVLPLLALRQPKRLVVRHQPPTVVVAATKCFSFWADSLR